MRRVYEFNGEPQTTGTCRAYDANDGTKPPEWHGSRCELLVVDCLNWQDDQKRETGDVLHIEGDTKSVRAALQELLNLLDASEAWAREQFERHAGHWQVCPSCGRWSDAKSQWHGDGHGKACYGLLEVRKALVAAEEPGCDDCSCAKFVAEDGAPKEGTEQ